MNAHSSGAVDIERVQLGKSAEPSGIAPGSLSDLAYKELRDRVLLGQSEDTAWHSVKALADELGVSRTPVREALVRLHNEHLLERDATGRFVPVTITYSRAADIFVTRAANEGMAARLAAIASTPEHIATLETICEESWKSHKSNQRERLIDQNDEFHAELLRIAGAKGLVDAIDKANALMYKYRQTTLINPERIVRSLRTHDEITALVKERRPDDAEAAARNHVFAAGRVFIDAIALFVPIDKESPSTQLLQAMTQNLRDL